MGLTVEQAMAAYTNAATPSLTADYNILVVDGADLRTAHLALSRSGFPSLLVPVHSISADSTRLTHGIAVSAATCVEFVRRGERWSCPAAVVECRDPELVRTFAALVGAVVARLEDGPLPSWASVSSLLFEWQRLLGRRQLLSGASELGLWGELWCIAHSSRAPMMLEAWRGPEGERVDFLLDSLGVEVKVGRRERVHMVSQSQVNEPLGDVPVIFMSMYVMVEPRRGRGLPELVREVARQLDDTAAFEEKLASVGYSRDDEEGYDKRCALLGSPLFYRREDIPRVRSADPGVSDLRYCVELSPDVVLTAEARSAVIDVLGLNEPVTGEYPCA